MARSTGAGDQNMGIGEIGFRENPVKFKRKFRWTLRFTDICNAGEVPEHFVKLAARPSLTIEETEINFLHGKTWIPGKGAWETITVTYYDVVAIDLNPLWTWLWNVYNFSDPEGLHMADTLDGYSGVGVLTLWDGCGVEIEEWELRQAWPQAINFGELDYANSEECTVELTLRYSEVKYTPKCNQPPADPCCIPCQA